MCKMKKEYSGENIMGPQGKKHILLENRMKIWGVGKISLLLWCLGSVI